MTTQANIDEARASIARWREENLEFVDFGNGNVATIEELESDIEDMEEARDLPPLTDEDRARLKKFGGGSAERIVGGAVGGSVCGAVPHPLQGRT